MFFFDFLLFSTLIDSQYFEFTNNHKYKHNFLNIQNILKTSNNIENNKIGIIDFRFILKSSNAMKLLGNKFLTLLSNMLSNLNLTDMEVCYKVFKAEIIKNINLQENKFGFEPEVTAKIAKKNIKIYEVGIKYFGRKYSEGKKITWKDGFSAIRCIIKYNLFG